MEINNPLIMIPIGIILLFTHMIAYFWGEKNGDKKWEAELKAIHDYIKYTNRKLRTSSHED